MSKQVTVLDKTFELFIPYEQICADIQKVAQRMKKDLQDENPLFVCVLNGAFRFAAELINLVDYKCEISFVKLASYSGTVSTGKVYELIGLTQDVEDRTVVIIEDIVDTGLTMQDILKNLSGRRAKAVKVCTLLLKPDSLKCQIDIDYVGREIPNDFIVGYGLDYDNYGRELNDIYSIVQK